eukprot:CAMPEP_0113965058 /NCGR_PEP_ID=MMETSP0011_2-20120614/7527_1 /TAXON_ID=101924 /ORGANISM="Rhodosorus marinus" /LENGTH=335 /DNA_ID=CAMNT_0000977515 /DNA_START=457 /DNA_END=1461 /DNA_ORIENTATION=+ /assembly_acc=CAM_ASM_000156
MTGFVSSKWARVAERVTVSKMTRPRSPLVYSPEYSVQPWPREHRFVMSKFHDLAESLREDGYLTGPHVHVPEYPSESLIESVHESSYVRAFNNGTLDDNKLREIGFRGLWSPELVRRTNLEVAGTVLAAELALESGLACNLGGGTHHAHRDRGSGFTIFNDLAVAAVALLDKGVDRILICDLDVHQGDGTASIFEERPEVCTFSMHCQSNFPFRKCQSTLDIGLEDGVGDEEYLRILKDQLIFVLKAFQPEFVLYDAGVDPHVDDELGKLNLTDNGLFARDVFVMTECLSRGMPVAGVIGGGYHRDRRVLGRRHSILHRAAETVWEQQSIASKSW